MPARLLAAIVLSLVSCSGGAPEGERPVPAQQIPEDVAAALPPPDETLALGLAGVPNALLGDESEPAFGEVFSEIAEYGFDHFVPVFLTSESGEGGDYGTYFVPTTALPEALFGPIPAERTCEGPHNPWAAAEGILEVILPGYLLAMDVPWDSPLEPSLAESRLEDFLQRCIEGDTSRAGTIYSYDEPANNYATSLCCDGDPDVTFSLDNVATLADAADEVLGAQTLVIEAPLPFFLPLVAEPWGIPPEMVGSILSDFEAGVAATAPHADRYGFDVYPVDLTPSLSVIPEHVALAKQSAPQAEPIIVLQGFGAADMGIDNGTPGRKPTRDETRAMSFLALSAGARGVYWYGQSALQPSDALWSDLREIGRDLRTLSGIFQLPPAEIPEGASVPDGLTLDLRDGGSALWALLVDREGGGGTVVLPSSSPARDALTGEIFPAEGGTITVELGPYGSRMLAFLE